MDGLFNWISNKENKPNVPKLLDDTDNYGESFKTYVTNNNANDLIKSASSEKESDKIKNISKPKKCARIKHRRFGVYMSRADQNIQNLMEQVGKWRTNTVHVANSANRNDKEITSTNTSEEFWLLLNHGDTKEKVSEYPI